VRRNKSTSKDTSTQKNLSQVGRRDSEREKERESARAREIERERERDKERSNTITL